MTVPDFHIRRVQTEEDWETVVQIRTTVFIKEQGCPPEEEWDEYDATDRRFSSCRHFLGLWNDKAVTTARWHEAEYAGKPAAKLERFAVLSEARGNGLGKAMIEHVVNDARQAGYAVLVLHAQTYLEKLYTKLGFRPIGNVFDEAGIPHVKMISTREP